MSNLYPQVTGLDGVTRDWNDVFNLRYGERLSTSERSGYIVRRTNFDRDVPHVDEHWFPATAYGKAMEYAHQRRASVGAAGYVVIDGLYNVNGREVRING